MIKIKKPTIIVVSVLLSLIACGILWAAQSKSTAPNLTQRTPKPALPSQRASEIPEQVFYGEVFSLLVALKNTADYQNQAGLTSEEASILTEIAKDCQRDVANQDAKAQTIIQAFRERLRKSKPNKLPDKVVPPPDELTKLQKGRNAIVLHHRDRLREAIGEEAFKRFTVAAGKIVNITLTPVQ